MLLDVIKKALKIGWDLIDEKVFNFLKQVFNGKTGTFLDKYHKEINEAVKIVEEIVEFVETKQAANSYQLMRDVNFSYDIDLDDKSIELILTDSRKKSTIKHEIAYNLVKEKLDYELKSGEKNALDLGIDLAVARFFN